MTFTSYRFVCGILVPRPGIKPTFSALEGGFLTTGEPGKSHIIYFLKALFTIRTTNTVEASETHGEVMLLRRFLWLFLSQAPTPEAVRAGVGQRPCVSTPFSPGSLAQGSVKSVSKHYSKWLAPLQLWCSNGSSEHSENSPFFKVDEHSFYNLLTLCVGQATNISDIAKLKFS